MASCIDAGDRRWCWAGGALHVVQWGDEAAVFHEASASTHLLDTDSHLIIACLRETPGSASTAQLWQRAFGCPPQWDDCRDLAESLEALARAGLVTSETP